MAPTFPICLWDKLLPQAELALNLLRQSNSTPNILAYAHMHGPFDYHQLPLAPMGCKALVCIDPKNKGTWAQHAAKGWYIGTSPDHYRAHIINVADTGSDRVSKSVYFKHKYITNPAMTHANKVVEAARALCKALTKAWGKKSDKRMADLTRLSEIFTDTAKTLQDNEWHAPATTSAPSDPPHPPQPAGDKEQKEQCTPAVLENQPPMQSHLEQDTTPTLPTPTETARPQCLQHKLRALAIENPPSMTMTPAQDARTQHKIPHNQPGRASTPGSREHNPMADTAPGQSVFPKTNHV